MYISLAFSNLHNFIRTGLFSKITLTALMTITLILAGCGGETFDEEEMQGEQIEQAAVKSFASTEKIDPEDSIISLTNNDDHFESGEYNYGYCEFDFNCPEGMVCRYYTCSRPGFRWRNCYINYDCGYSPWLCVNRRCIHPSM